jgi:hypothetical protein
VTYTQPGTHSITAVYSGTAGFSTSTSSARSQSVAYAVRLLYNPAKPNKRGSTVPIKLQLLDAASRNVSSSAIVLTVTGLSPSPAPGAPPSGTFKYLPPKQGLSYQFDVKTTKYPAGTYTLSFTAGTDPTTHTATFVLL